MTYSVCNEVAFSSRSRLQLTAEWASWEEGAVTPGRHVATALTLPKAGPLQASAPPLQGRFRGFKLIETIHDLTEQLTVLGIALRQFLDFPWNVAQAKFSIINCVIRSATPLRQTRLLPGDVRNIVEGENEQRQRLLRGDAQFHRFVRRTIVHEQAA